MKPVRLTRWTLAGAWLLTVAVAIGLGVLLGVALRRGQPAAGSAGDSDGWRLAEQGLLLQRLTGYSDSRADLLAATELSEDWKLALANLLRLEPSSDLAYAARQLAAGINPRLLPEAVAHLGRLPQGAHQEEAFLAFLERWATQDGRSALAFALSHGQWDRESAVGRALRGWCQHNPSGAWQWVLDNSPSRSLEAARLQAVLTGLSATQPDLAFGLASGFPEEDTRNLLLESFTGEFLRAGPPQVALRWLENLPPGRARAVCLARLAGEWARHQPAEVSAWVSALPDRESRAAAGRELLRSWAEIDPSAAARWVQDQPAGADRAAQLNTFAEAWIAMEGPGPVSRWLNQHEPHRDFDRARQALALEVALDDPEVALTWAHTISHPDDRAFTLTVIGRRWLEEEPAVAAERLRSDPEIPGGVRQLLLGPNVVTLASPTPPATPTVPVPIAAGEAMVISVQEPPPAAPPEEAPPEPEPEESPEDYEDFPAEDDPGEY